MSKKLISVLLAVVMVLATGTVALVSVSADLADLPEQAENTYRYYFYMPDQWLDNDYAETAGIYWWEGTGAHSAWPGMAATKADVDGVYYCDVPDDVTTIIWSNFVDGGQDPTLDIYKAAIQTKNIPCEYYDPGESDVYPEGNDGFDGMIYVTDCKKVQYDDYGGKLTYGGEWYYYYGNGEYGTAKNKADAEVVYTDSAFNLDDFKVDDGAGQVTTDPSTAATTAPVEPGTTAPVEPGTTAATTTTVAEPTTVTTAPTEPAVKNTVALNNGEEYVVSNGDVLTYTVDLTAEAPFEDIQALVNYDAAMLKLTRITSDDPYTEDWEVEGPAFCPNLDGVILNASGEGVVKFNASKPAGYRFNEKATLITLEFTVIADGNTEIDLVIEEMTIKGGNESYFAGGEAVKTEGITVEQYITGNTIPTDPTTVPTTATTAPTTVTTAPVEPGTTAPVEPGTTAPVVPGTTADKAEPTTATAPAASSDATGEAGTTAAGTNGAVDTGAAAYLYVVLAVITMAACAVVVLRKRANG